MAAPAKKRTADVFRYPQRVERIARSAALKARARAKKLGLSVTYVEDGVLVREFPDGKVKKLSRTTFKRTRVGRKGLKLSVAD